MRDASQPVMVAQTRGSEAKARKNLVPHNDERSGWTLLLDQKKLKES